MLQKIHMQTYKELSKMILVNHHSMSDYQIDHYMCIQSGMDIIPLIIKVSPASLTLTLFKYNGRQSPPEFYPLKDDTLNHKDATCVKYSNLDIESYKSINDLFKKSVTNWVDVNVNKQTERSK